MRIMAVLAFAVSVVHAAPALSDEWTRHVDGRLGYAVEIPPAYGRMEGPAGDRLVFGSADGDEVLTLSGGSVLPGSFESVWARVQAEFGADGWRLSYDPVPPNWTTFTGTRGERAVLVKLIPLCGGTKQYAMLTIAYPADETARLAPTLERLAGSLRASGSGTAC